MTTSAAVSRVLGCEVRTFSGVKSAVLWYVTQKGRRSLHALPLERGSGRASQAHIDQTHATYALLAMCIERQRDDADVDDEFFLFGRRVSDLVTWYLSSLEHVQQRMADTMGLTILGLARYCEVTESVIRRRMRARGLLT